MARERPFSFLDHTIRHGDSLLGIHTLDQLRYLHIDPEEGKHVHGSSQYDEAAKGMTKRVDEAARLCAELEAIPVNTIRQAREKHALNERAIATMSELSSVADAIVGIALAYASAPRKQIDEQFKNLGPELLAPGGAERLRESTPINLQSGRPDGAAPRVAFHWPLEFPEVFTGIRVGFDLIVGNPPFIGGQKLTGIFGTNYRDYIVATVAGGVRGSSDLVAYFFVRASQISTAFGFLASKTITEGATLRVGLSSIYSSGWRVLRAIRARKWPGAANVYISQIWGSLRQSRQPVLDGVNVPNIGPNLRAGLTGELKPFKLANNREIAFEGVILVGMGFALSPEEASILIAKDPRNVDVVRPFLTTDDVCKRTDQSASRFVIDFNDRSEQEAKAFVDCYAIIKKLVMPERQEKRPDGSFKQRAPLPQRWWQFAEKRPALRRAILALRNVIVMPITSKIMTPSIIANSFVFDQTLVVVASDDLALFATMASDVHRSWARRFGQTLVTRPRYTHGNCFETFPFPNMKTYASIGENLHNIRRRERTSASIGMTTLYNRVHDGDDYGEAINQLRELHEQLDRAVCDAYGWTDIDLGYGFHKTEEGQRWTMSEDAREEVLARLLELNHQRHAEEVAAGIVAQPAGNGARKGTRKAKLGTEGVSLFPDLR